MKALITGNKGFIGSHLMKRLQDKGWEVIGLDNNFHPSRNNVGGVIGDIRNRQLVNELVSQVDIVFHLAAIIHVDYSIKYPHETIDVNVGGTLNILEACRKYDKRLIFASTSEVYGSSKSEFMSEEHALDGQSPYAASKTAADRLCKSYIDTYDLEIGILRNFNTFGKYQNDGSYGGVIAIFTRQALEGKPITIYGDGEQERDYMHVSDAIKGYEIASNIIGTLNIGTGKTIKIKELAEMIKDITGSKSDIIHLEDRAGEVQRLCAGINKAKTLGFKPSTDLKKNLTDYIKWYERDIFNKN